MNAPLLPAAAAMPGISHIQAKAAGLTDYQRTG
jgi:hypothetical protein